MASTGPRQTKQERKDALKEAKKIAQLREQVKDIIREMEKLDDNGDNRQELDRISEVLKTVYKRLGNLE